jgi:hypothetical protein
LLLTATGFLSFMYVFTLREEREPYVGFEVLIAVTTKISVFWVITPCNLVKANGRFGGTYRLYFHGRRVIRTAMLLYSCWFFFFGGVGLPSPGTAATSGLLYSPR